MDASIYETIFRETCGKHPLEYGVITAAICVLPRKEREYGTAAEWHDTKHCHAAHAKIITNNYGSSNAWATVDFGLFSERDFCGEWRKRNVGSVNCDNDRGVAKWRATI